MLAVLTVSNLDDTGLGSLRDTIATANSNGSADTINFSVTGTIDLTSGELAISESQNLTIDGGSQITIDANNASRIFNIIAISGDFSLAGLTLTGGRTTGDNVSGPGFPDTTFSGGAVRSLTAGNLTLDQSTIDGNSTEGDRAYGGGIFSIGDITVTSSTVSGNSTAGHFAIGGGINSLDGTVTLISSVVSGNTTAGDAAHGGGVQADAVILTRSTLSGNSTTGNSAFGGGLNSGPVTLTDSTVSGNSTADFFAQGGGIHAFSVTLTNSTVSGNSTAGQDADGGGIFSSVGVTMNNSTVFDNRVTHNTATGGGIWNFNGTVTLANSIVAGNTAGSVSPDIDPGIGALDAVFSLIGDNDGTGLAEAQTTDVFGNLIGDADGNFIGSAAGAGVLDPLLGPLIDNGGPTLPNGAAILTHALLFGSPAIDAGDPVAAPGALGVPLYDQRGNNFGRVQNDRLFDGSPNDRIDMGAFEVRQTFDADFDGSNFVDGADFLAWQRGFGTAAPNATKSDGDADNDGDTDAADLSRWEDQFGQFAGGPLLGAPLEIDFMNPNSDATVESVLINVDSSWIGQGGYFFDIEITGEGSNLQQHGTQLVALDDTTVFDVDGPLTSVIVDWTTDTTPRQANEIYTVCVQILRFLGDDGTFELFGDEKCRDFGPF